MRADLTSEEKVKMLEALMKEEDQRQAQLKKEDDFIPIKKEEDCDSSDDQLE